MFNELQTKLTTKLKRIVNRGVIRDQHIEDGLSDIKISLLQADVNYRVVNSFLRAVKARALGQKIGAGLTASQTFIKIVHDELKNMLGQTTSHLHYNRHKLNVIMLMGLQGSGKTSTAGKLGNYLKTKGSKPLLVSLDLFRAAAVKQLKVLANQSQVAFFEDQSLNDIFKIAQRAHQHALQHNFSHLIVDTQGRLQIDTDLMSELASLTDLIKPAEKLLVVDSMMGQEAFNVAREFDEKLAITGFIVTKLDSDTRGGAVLSLRAITNKPIKFAAHGEKLEDLDQFHPDRIASSILGMGDVLGLIEKIKGLENTANEKLPTKKITGELSLDDFLQQVGHIDKIGIKSILSNMPGMSGVTPQETMLDSEQAFLKKMRYISQSMTKKERAKPSLLNASRKIRIAKGSGAVVSDINKLLKKFNQFKTITKKMSRFSNPADIAREFSRQRSQRGRFF